MSLIAAGGLAVLLYSSEPCPPADYRAYGPGERTFQVWPPETGCWFFHPERGMTHDVLGPSLGVSIGVVLASVCLMFVGFRSGARAVGRSLATCVLMLGLLGWLDALGRAMPIIGFLSLGFPLAFGAWATWRPTDLPRSRDAYVLAFAQASIVLLLYWYFAGSAQSQAGIVIAFVLSVVMPLIWTAISSRLRVRRRPVASPLRHPRELE